MMNSLKAYGELCKIRIALFSVFSSVTGFLLIAKGVKPQLALLVPGVFLLACGSSAFNQYQERNTDAVMQRTRTRPLPTGRVRPEQALYFSFALIFSGLFILLMTGSVKALLLGLFAIIWYNGVYTYLKKKSAFAVVPGALVGVMPPAIGWSAGGAGLFDPALAVVCLFFFLWQVPHFWLIAAEHGEEYSRAGFPAITSVFSSRQLVRIILVWIASGATITLFFMPFKVAFHPEVGFMIWAAALWVILQAVRPLWSNHIPSGEVLKSVNRYALAVMLLLCIDRMI